MTRSTRHVLVVSFGYPPLPHVSGRRASNMARELTALGWDVSVLTVDWSVPLPSAIASLEQSVERALAEHSPRRLAIDGRLASADFDPHAVPPLTAMKSRRSVPWRRLLTFRGVVGWGSVGAWARNAYEAARRLHAQRPIDVVWPIHGDDSSHEIAHQLRRRLGIPWVADFKDPWSFGYSSPAVPIVRRVTARRLGTAAAVTETCAWQADADRREFGRPTHVVYSGYDAELMAEVEPERPSAAFCIAYLGTIAQIHDVRLLPGLFQELRRRGALANGAVELHQYSRPTGQLRQQLASVGCADAVRDHEPVPVPRAFALMRGVDVLLIFPQTRLSGRGVGLKEIECVASGTPVLVLGEPLEELVPLFRACPQVWLAHDVSAAADLVERELARVREQRSSRAGVNQPPLREFTWTSQASGLSQILDGAACR